MFSFRFWLLVSLLGVGLVACADPPPERTPSEVKASKDKTKKTSDADEDATPRARPPAPGDARADEAPPISPSSPKLTAITPTSTPAGAGVTVDITLTGTQFVAESIVGIGDQSVTPISSTDTEIRMRLPAALLANAATLPVKIQNPPTKGGASNALSFTVTSAASTLVLASLNPAFASQGGARGVDIVVSGSGFTQSSRVRFNGADLRTTFRSAAELAANVPATSLRLAGAYSVTVYDPQSRTVSSPRSFDVRSTSTPSFGSGASSCALRCADYGYSSGQCYENYTCQNGCLVAGRCESVPSCSYRCSTYNYVAGQCLGDWECRNDGCLVPKTCGGTTTPQQGGATTCEYPCAGDAWGYAVGECKDNYECGADNCLHAKVCASTTSTAAATCEYPCNDPLGAYSYAAGECRGGYECEADGCLQAKTCANATTQTASCEYACAGDSWSYATGECKDGYECGGDGCLRQKVCSGATATTPVEGGGTTTTSCTYPCVDPFGDYAYAENECSAGYCCFQGCLYDETSFGP